MESKQAISALGALAQETRLQTFRLLVSREPEGIAAGELARLLDVPQNTMSSHLSALTRAGLIAGERHSRSIIYRAKLDAVQHLALYLVEDCCGGRAELCEPIVASLNRCAPKISQQMKEVQ